MNHPPICRDLQHGYCRYGASCKFYHPPSNTGNRAPSGPTNRNPTGPSSRSFSTASSANAIPVGARPGGGLKYQFNEDTLRVELQAETPNWILSSFGAGKYEPNLFFGYDTSPEELRWKSVQALNENRAQDYVKEEESLLNQARTTISQALGNLPKSRELAEKLHDARYPPGTTIGGPRPAEFSEATVLTSAGPASVGGGFGRKPAAFGGAPAGGFGSTPTGPKSASGSPAGASAFGAPAFGQKSAGASAFGAPAFGAPAAPATSAFGGVPAASAFGGTPAKSAFGSGSTPAFGSTTSPSSGSAFGASAYGSRPADSAFGTTSTPAQPAPTSVFGSSSTPTSVFGSSAFGSTATPTSASAFGSSAFSSAAKPAAAASASGSGTSLASGSEFGQTAFGLPAKPSAFGRFGQNQASSMSQPASGFSAFGGSTSGRSGLGGFSGASTSNPAPPASSTSTSAFGTTSPFNTPSSAPPPFSALPSTSTSANPFQAASPSPPYSTATATPNFPPDVAVPAGWSHDDPWSWLLPTVEGGGEGGKLEEDVVRAFRGTMFELRGIPLMAPPVGLRGC